MDFEKMLVETSGMELRNYAKSRSSSSATPTSDTTTCNHERDENEEKKIDTRTVTRSCSEGSLEAAQETSEITFKPRLSHQILLLICGFLACFQTLGLGQAYGMFQLFHSENAGKPTSMLPKEEATSRAGIASVGSLGGGGICLILGLFLVPLLCRASVASNAGATLCRRCWPNWSIVSWMSAAGSMFILVGYVCASYATHLWHLIIGQGVLVGIGSALVFNPVMMIAPEYFETKVRGKATGLISAGAGVGGLVYSPIIRLLNDKFGIRNTLRSVGIVTGLTGLVFVALLVPPARPCTRRSFLPKQVRKDPIFYLAVAGGFAASLTALIPYGFGPEFSTLLNFRTKTAAVQLSVLNAVGTPARIAWGHLRDKIGSQNALILASSLLAISNFMWLGAAEDNGKVVWWTFLVVWGIGTSGYGTIIAPYVLDVFDNEVYFGTVAVINFARGIGSVIGTPLAGAIVGKGDGIGKDGRYFRGLIIFNGAMLLVTVVTSVAARVLHARREGWKWMA